MLSYLIMIKEIIAENNNVILLKIINTDKSKKSQTFSLSIFFDFKISEIR